MPMNFEIKVEKQTSLSQEEVRILQALEVLKETCINNSVDCGQCPLWSIELNECAFFGATPSEIDLKPNKVFRAIK